MTIRLKTILALAVLAICFSYKANSQQQGFSTQLLYFPSTACLGCSDTFIVRIKNLDSAIYTGFVNISVSHDTNSFSVASLCSIPQITVAGFDSIQNTCNITFDSTYFNTGNNIVVVWSSGNAKMPADTAWTNVFLNPAGVHEISNSPLFAIHPSLASSFVQIELTTQEICLEKIRILDVFGREVHSVVISKREKKNLVDISSLRSGVYFLEVSSGNLRNTRKFVKID